MNIPKQLLLAAFLCAASLAPVTADEPKGKITGYGILTPAKTNRVVKSPETATATRKVTQGMGTITTTTTNIPAKLGLSFGIHYQVTNLPIEEGELDLIRMGTTPALTNPNGRTSTSYEYPVRRTVHNGKIISEAFYTFDNEWELVPGRWTFEIKFNGRSLCKQEFTVVRE